MDLALFEVAQRLFLTLIIAILPSTFLPLTLNKWLHKNVYLLQRY